MSGHDSVGAYRGPCPKCGARLVGLSKPEYVQHLRENGEMLAAKVEEKLVVERDCADAKPTDDGEVCNDASGYQPEKCPQCLRDTNAYVEVIIGDNATVSKKHCSDCGHDWVERYINPGSGQEGER